MLRDLKRRRLITFVALIFCIIVTIFCLPYALYTGGISILLPIFGILWCIKDLGDTNRAIQYFERNW